MQKIFSNLVFMVLLNLVVKPVAIFGIDATVQNRLGDYGLYFSLLNLSYLFAIVMDLGINNYTTKSVAQYPNLLEKNLSRIFSFRFILFGVYAIITLGIAVGLGYQGRALTILLMLVFNQFLITLIAYFRSHFGGLHLFKTDAVISVMDKFVMIVAGGFLLWFPGTKMQLTIENYVLLQSFSYIITFLLAFFLLVQKTGFPRFRLSWVFSLAILKKSYPYALLILLMMIYTRTDSVMLERMRPDGTYQSGLYARGFRLLDAGFMFAMLFANILLPVFARMLKEEPKGIRQVLKSTSDVLIAGSVVVAFICFANAPAILQTVYRVSLQEAATSFAWLMWGFIPMCVSLIYGTLLTAKGDLRFLNQISAVGIVLNIVINALLIPQYGAAGSAFATLITQGFTALAQLVYVHQSMNFSYSGKQVVRYLVLISGLTLTILFIQAKWQFWFHALIGFVLLLVLRFLDVTELKKLLKTKLAIK